MPSELVNDVQPFLGRILALCRGQMTGFDPSLTASQENRASTDYECRTLELVRFQRAQMPSWSIVLFRWTKTSD